MCRSVLRKVWRYQMATRSVNRRTDNTMPKIKRRKGQRMIYKTLHRKIKIEQHEHEPDWNRGELRCSGRVSSSCSTSSTLCVTVVTNPVINHEWGQDDRIVITTNWTYPWSFVTQTDNTNQNKKDKRTNHELQNTTQKMKDSTFNFICIAIINKKIR